jgi:hypothetical protein
MADEIDTDDEDFLDDLQIIDNIEATEYTIGYSIEDNEMRIQFHNEFGVLSSMVTDAAGAYELANRILRAYDKLEGL